MQLPVVVFRLKDKLFVTEYHSDMNYNKFVQFINMLVPENVLSKGLSKESLKMLCDLASSEKDRKLIRVAATAHVSATEAKTKLGVSDLVAERETVSKALEQYIDIRDAVDKVVCARETASLEELGIHIISSESETDSCNDDEELEEGEASRESTVNIAGTQSLESEHFNLNGSQENHGQGNMQDNHMQRTSAITSDNLFGNSDPDNISKERAQVSEAQFMFIPSFEHLLLLLRENDLNWFNLVAEMKLTFHQLSSEAHDQLLLDFSEYLSSSDLTAEEDLVVEQTRQAFLALQRERSMNIGQERNDTFTTDSESDDPEDWVRLKNLAIYSDEVKQKIKKQRAIFQRQRKRKIAKIVSSRCLLRRQIPPRASKTMKKYPDIGNVIEDFARERRVGADSWRRTGLLTFSGNVKRGPKVTYRTIKGHLEKTYNTKFGYGTVVQLCSVHNKRKLSSRRYWGAAQIISRRTRKGFNVKLNVDAKWSCSMYRLLDHIQLKDGLDKVIINRDDAAGFRLDTTYTHKQHPILQEKGKPELTSRTDFVNKYTTVLQTTSYLFMGTENTSQICVGVVKPHKIVPKNPGQHAADLVKLSSIPEVKPAVHGKTIECGRVDGAVDEGPSHHEVQFHWSERHLQQGTLCTMVTARFSGGSYLNRVELQNGCLALGHSNVFIPSTINGTNLDANGKLDMEKLKQNLETATDVYINTVSGSPCLGTEILLVKGATGEKSVMYHERRSNLLTFLRGSKKKVEVLRRSNPEDFKYFTKIWELRRRHMVLGLPSNYMFMLLPCYEVDCPHPVCAKGKPAEEPTWYPGGPPLSLLLVPIPDPERPWGSELCTKCPGFCSGHYLNPEAHIKWVSEKGSDSCQRQPPRVLIEEYVKGKESIGQEDIEHLAKMCFLSVEDAEACANHHMSIHERRREVQKKRKRKTRKEQEDRNCQVDNQEESVSYCICRRGEEGFMIQCSDCNEWFHGECIQVTEEDADQIADYFCATCLQAAN